ncbi:80_t:CDS:2 [Ambispora leptoticha]|uniref:80_t:CDS:1 n=1 Tax=Ambispora leptoticha TaxID=144679 RepID=A0A9N9B6P7_9GLOM|nr:80_t:CDS:2 [Ambispora leptoticha]
MASSHTNTKIMVQKSNSNGISKTKRVNASSRNRKNNTTPDTTGRRHLWIVRNEIYKSPRNVKKKITETQCRKCLENDESIEIIETNIESLEKAVNKLSSTINKRTNYSFINFAQPFSHLNIDDLLNLSMQFSIPNIDEKNSGLQNREFFQTNDIDLRFNSFHDLKKIY